jgi:hypothetical protein
VRQLHVLGVSDDGDTLLLGTAKQGKVTHRLPLDSRLRQAIRGQLTAPGSDRAESVLSPKEIQARMRAGATPDEVAKVARVPVARVMPYFAPVEAERERIVEEARRAVLHRNRAPAPTQPLGDVVDARLREVAGLKDDSVAWTARRRADGAWVVRLTYSARGGQRRAEWLWRPLGRELSALDASATRLAAEGAPPKRKPVRRPAAKKAAPRKAAPRKAATRTGRAGPARKAAAAKPGRTAKAASARPAAAKAGTATRSRPATATKAAATRKPATAAKKAAPATATRKTAAATKAAATKAAAARKAAATKAAATKAAATKAAATKAAATKAAAAKKATARRAAAAAAAAPASPPRPPKPSGRTKVAAEPAVRPRVLEVVPDPTPDPPPMPMPMPMPVEPVSPAPAAAAVPPPPARRPGTRVPVPSWSDVLLGVTGPVAAAAGGTETADGADGAAGEPAPRTSSGSRRRRT